MKQCPSLCGIILCATNTMIWNIDDQLSSKDRMTYLWYTLKLHAISERAQCKPYWRGIKTKLTVCPPAPLPSDCNLLSGFWRCPRGDGQKGHCCWNGAYQRTVHNVGPCMKHSRKHSILITVDMRHISKVRKDQLHWCSEVFWMKVALHNPVGSWVARPAEWLLVCEWLFRGAKPSWGPQIHGEEPGRLDKGNLMMTMG